MASPVRGLRVVDHKEAVALVDAMHITASVFINDDEYGLHQDYEKWLEGLAPHAPIRQYRHNDTGEGNADAHLKRNAIRSVARDGARGGRRRDQRPAGLWHLGAHLLW
jgi:thiamine phosphate synthase YjbQ (UPF0047 family)